MNAFLSRPMLAAIVASVALIASMRDAHADCTEREFYGATAVFKIEVHGNDFNVQSIHSHFEDPNPLGGIELTNAQVEISFYDKKNDRYNFVRLGKKSGTHRSGDFTWAPKGGFKAKSGKVKVRLYENEGSKRHVVTAECNIHE